MEISHPSEIIPVLSEQGYIIDEEMATTLFLMIKLNKPLLMEGPPGVGKTESALMMAQLLETDLIRLQCYEGLDVHSALYEWNYQKQLLSIKIQEKENLTVAQKESVIFSDEYLLKRPLLKAITSDRPVVLLIDEIDRADEEFEAFLLELLSAYQISIPELGTIKAKSIPYVILTSNRTRELSDALKRRCLYNWISYPDFDREKAIVLKHLPNIENKLADQIVNLVQRMRTLKLDKTPGIAETIDWAKGILALKIEFLDVSNIESTLSCILKSNTDIQNAKIELVELIQ